MTKILLVEDDKSLREIYGVRLLAEGYDIVSAGDGEEALALAIKDRPALIVSDVMMPKISGFDMLDILRSTTETRGIKVIMMTALSSEDQRLRGQQLGADRYLVKSQVGIEDVVRTVHEVLADAPTSSTDFATPPVSAPAQQQMTQPQMSTPTPTPIAPPRPAPTVPERQVAPTPAPVSITPFPPAPSPQPTTSAPTPSMAAPLPEPTAPFSTPRPTNPSNRVIEPLATIDSNPAAPLADMMDRELRAAAPSEPSTTSTPQQPLNTSLTENPVPPAQAPVEDHGLSFEEIPAQNTTTPPQSPPSAAV